MPALYYIEHASYGCGDAVTLHIRWNGTRMIVDLDRHPCPDATENILIDKYTSACRQGDEDELNTAEDDLLDAINGAGRHTFDQLAPPSTAEPTDLHSILFPPQYSFSLITVAGRLELLLEGSYHLELSDPPEKGYKNVIPIPSSGPPTPHFASVSFQLEFEQDPELPRYQTTKIQVVEKLLGDGYISHVNLDGRDMCAKVGQDLYVRAIQREFDCLEKITSRAAQQTSPVNIPKLLGLVEATDGGKVIGILEELVPEREGQEFSTLAMINDISAVPRERRERWASKVRQTVDWLHSIGVVWGNAKTDNVLVHGDTDEAWLVNFGGGWTEGWVDEDKAETVDGDNQAVGRIIDFLLPQ